MFGTIYPLVNYVRFLGFTVDSGPGVPITGGNAVTAPPAFYIGGTGNEVGYCTVIGRYIATGDNHDGIRIEDANETWIHHNNIYGVTGDAANSAGVKLYREKLTLLSDNYIHNCRVGIFDKMAASPDGSTQSTYTRNYVANNTEWQFVGNGYNNQANFVIYDNVSEGNVNLGALNTNSQVYNNLILNITQVFNGQTLFYGASIWNNIALSGGQPLVGFIDQYEAFAASGSAAQLAYMDYNVYDGAPSYDFGGYVGSPSTFNLSQMRTQGFEQHSQVVSSDLSIFQDLTSYALLPQWNTAGRYGDPVGPRYPVAQILNTNRYGARALN